VEVVMRRSLNLTAMLGAAAALVFGPMAAAATGLTVGPRVEIPHPGTGHEVHLSAPAVAAGSDGQPLVAWMAQAGHGANVYVARPGPGESRPVRVNPDGLLAESLHQSPGLAAGPGAAVYVSWASLKAKPAGVLFASDLQLSRSLDGARTFERPLRVNEDRPTSHSFEGLAVGSDGPVLVGWIDAREGEGQTRSYLARIVGRGGRVEGAVKLDDGETCVCCRLDVAAGDGVVAALWRKVFPGNIRDMVLGLSRDGGRSFGPPSRVRVDGWKIAACPHRGGKVAIDGRGRVHAAWYTEGQDETPRVLYAASADGRAFDPAQPIAVAAGSVPDHVGLAVTRTGVVGVVWEESTAVRRRIRLRVSRDGGKTFGETHALSTAIKAYAPAIAATPAADIVVVWHEEQFPVTKTVVQTLRPAAAR
jgi:hypothetical protein